MQVLYMLLGLLVLAGASKVIGLVDTWLPFCIVAGVIGAIALYWVFMILGTAALSLLGIDDDYQHHIDTRRR